MSAAVGLLQGIHVALAMRRGPHWLLSDADAKDYGQKLANALRHIPVVVAQKYVDFSALGLAVFTYETPRVVTDIRLRQARQAERRRPPGPGPAQVFQFAPNPPRQAEPPPQQPPPQPPPAWSPDMTYEPDLGAAD